MKYEKPTYEKLEKAGKSNFFVRLCYGYVEGTLGKDTSQMTTSEVIQEFLNSKGYKSPKDFFNKGFRGNKTESKERPKADQKPRDFAGEKNKLINDSRVVYGRVVTKKKLEKTLDLGQDGMGELTARLFNEDAFGMKADNNNRSGAYYRPSENTVNFKMINFDFDDPFSCHEPGGTFYHECWHAIDNNYSTFSVTDRYGFVTSTGCLSTDYELATGKTFQQTLIDEFNKVDIGLIKSEIREEKNKDFETKYGITVEQAKARYDEFSTKIANLISVGDWDGARNLKNSDEYSKAKQEYDASRATLRNYTVMRKYAELSDVVDGFTGGADNLVGVGHSGDYWSTDREAKRAKEAFAEIASAYATNKASYETLKKWIPETVKAFEEIKDKLDNGEIKTKGRKKYEH